jgi:hypothetical protein
MIQLLTDSVVHCKRLSLTPSLQKRAIGAVTHALTLYSAANRAEYLMESSRNPDNLFKLNMQNEWEN